MEVDARPKRLATEGRDYEATGERRGKNGLYRCKVGACRYTGALKQSIMRHLEKDHQIYKTLPNH